MGIIDRFFGSKSTEPEKITDKDDQTREATIFVMRHADISPYVPIKHGEETMQPTIEAARKLGEFILSSESKMHISDMNIFTTGTCRTRETLRYVKAELERVLPTNAFYGDIYTDDFIDLTVDQKNELNRLANDRKNGILVIGHDFTLSHSNYLPPNHFRQKHNQIIATYPDGTCDQVAPTLIQPFSI